MARDPGGLGRIAVDADLLRNARRLRRALHQHPEVALHEHATARRVRAFLRDYGLRPWRSALGGTGLLYRIPGRGRGPAVLWRADLDALPIRERTGAAHASRRPGAHHACGHDGHMAMLAAALAQLARDRRHAGGVYGLFQPAEETGEGAERVLRALGRDRLRLDRVYAIHNHPGLPLGVVGVRAGTAARPSMGLEIGMAGRRTHASAPHLGRSPIPALARLALKIDGFAGAENARDRRAFASMVGLNSGPNNYGVSPGTASLAVTLRGDTQAHLDRLRRRVEAAASGEARRRALRVSLVPHDVFRETRNDARAAADVVGAARRAGLRVRRGQDPLSASEDFGRFTERWPGALALLGAGAAHAPLHAADYDFPDALLPLGARLWLGLAPVPAATHARSKARKPAKASPRPG